MARDRSFKTRSRAARTSTNLTDDLLDPVDPTKIALDSLLENTTGFDPALLAQQQELVRKKISIGLPIQDTNAMDTLKANSGSATWIAPTATGAEKNTVLRRARTLAGELHPATLQMREESLNRHPLAHVAQELRSGLGLNEVLPASGFDFTDHAEMLTRPMVAELTPAQRTELLRRRKQLTEDVGLSEEDAKHTLRSTNPEAQLQLLMKNMDLMFSESYNSDTIYSSGMFTDADILDKLRTAGVAGRGGPAGATMSFKADDLKGRENDKYHLGDKPSTERFVESAEAGAFFEALEEQERRDLAAGRPCFSNRNNTVLLGPDGQVKLPKFPQFEEIVREHIQKYCAGYLDEEIAAMGWRRCKNVDLGICKSVHVSHHVYQQKWGHIHDPKVHKRAAESAGGTQPVLLMTSAAREMKLSAERANAAIYARSMAVAASISERATMGVYWPVEFLTPNEEHQLRMFLAQREPAEHPHPHSKTTGLCCLWSVGHVFGSSEHGGVQQPARWTDLVA